MTGRHLAPVAELEQTCDPTPATPPSARVEISVGEHSIVVEAAEPLTTVANTALEMWKATDDPRPRLGPAIGFHTDLPDQAPPAEVSFPPHWSDPDTEPEPDDGSPGCTT